MKETTGELNLVVVVVLLISLLSAFFFGYLWPTLRNTHIQNAKCGDAMCDKNTLTHDGYVECEYIDKKGTKHNLTCIWKG